MIQTIKKLLGIGAGNSVNFKSLVEEGALILDVRTTQEFGGGHIKGSVNMPLNSLGSQIAKLNKDKTIITCCASGMRSASAQSLLKAKGFNVYNGGGWRGLQQKIK